MASAPPLPTCKRIEDVSDRRTMPNNPLFAYLLSRWRRCPKPSFPPFMYPYIPTLLLPLLYLAGSSLQLQNIVACFFTLVIAIVLGVISMVIFLKLLYLCIAFHVEIECSFLYTISLVAANTYLCNAVFFFASPFWESCFNIYASNGQSAIAIGFVSSLFFPIVAAFIFFFFFPMVPAVHAWKQREFPFVTRAHLAITVCFSQWYVPLMSVYHFTYYVLYRRMFNHLLILACFSCVVFVFVLTVLFYHFFVFQASKEVRSQILGHRLPFWLPTAQVVFGVIVSPFVHWPNVVYLVNQLSDQRLDPYGFPFINFLIVLALAVIGFIKIALSKCDTDYAKFVDTEFQPVKKKKVEKRPDKYV